VSHVNGLAKLAIDGIGKTLIAIKGTRHFTKIVVLGENSRMTLAISSGSGIPLCRGKIPFSLYAFK